MRSKAEIVKEYIEKEWQINFDKVLVPLMSELISHIENDVMDGILSKDDIYNIIEYLMEEKREAVKTLYCAIERCRSIFGDVIKEKFYSPNPSPNRALILALIDSCSTNKQEE